MRSVAGQLRESLINVIFCCHWITQNIELLGKGFVFRFRFSSMYALERIYRRKEYESENKQILALIDRL